MKHIFIKNKTVHLNVFKVNWKESTGVIKNSSEAGESGVSTVHSMQWNTTGYGYIWSQPKHQVSLLFCSYNHITYCDCNQHCMLTRELSVFISLFDGWFWFLCREEAHASQIIHSHSVASLWAGGRVTPV